MGIVECKSNGEARVHWHVWNVRHLIWQRARELLACCACFCRQIILQDLYQWGMYKGPERKRTWQRSWQRWCLDYRLLYVTACKNALQEPLSPPSEQPGNSVGTYRPRYTALHENTLKYAVIFCLEIRHKGVCVLISWTENKDCLKEVRNDIKYRSDRAVK